MFIFVQIGKLIIRYKSIHQYANRHHPYRYIIIIHEIDNFDIYRTINIYYCSIIIRRKSVFYN